MRLDLGPSLEELRAQALAAVDARAAVALRALRDPAFAGLDSARVAETRALLGAPPALRTAERFPTLAVSAGPGELTQRAPAVLAAQDEIARQQREIEARRLQERARVGEARRVREVRGVVGQRHGTADVGLPIPAQAGLSGG